MKAPDKIYLHGYEFDDEPCKSWEIEPKVKGMRGYPAIHAEYVLKDFLLEWAKEKKAELLNDEELTDVAAGINMGMDMLIYKLKTL